MDVPGRYWRITVDGYHDWCDDESAANAARTNGYEVAGPYVLDPPAPRGAVDPCREALREVTRRAEGANARSQWVAEPAREALDA